MKSILGKLAKSSNKHPEKPSKMMENTNLVGGCAIFRERPPRIADCQNHIVRILKAFSEGQKFGENDIQDMFFAVSELYDNKDLQLHRIILLLLKEMPIEKTYTFMIDRSMGQDLTSNITINKAEATRVMAKILPVETLTSHERDIRPMFSARDSVVLSSCLMYSLRLCLMGQKDMIGRWVTEISNAVTNYSYAQYLALLVLYFLRQGDATQLKRMIDQNKDRCNFSSLSSHVLIAAASEAQRLNNTVDMSPYLLSRLKMPNVITQLDACRAILKTPNMSEDSLKAAVARLRSFLSSSNRILCFSSLRTISEYAPSLRQKLSDCNADLERLINDSDNTISSLAAISLLYTGVDSTIDRVLPVISQYTERMPTEQKVMLVKSCVDVATSSGKHSEIVQFLWYNFRKTDALAVQQVLIQSLFDFCSNIEATRVAVIEYLCEYLEDSSFCSLTILIIRYLAENARENDPHLMIIRAFVNRMNLDSDTVRAAIIDGIASFDKFPASTKTVRKIISKYLQDENDEVRDRAILYTRAFAKGYEEILNVRTEEVTVTNAIKDDPSEAPKEVAKEEVDSKLDFSHCGKEINKFGPICCLEDDIVINYFVRVFEEKIAITFEVTNTLDEPIHNVSVVLNEIDSDEQGDEQEGESYNSKAANNDGTIEPGSSDVCPFVISLPEDGEMIAFRGIVQLTGDDDETFDRDFDDTIVVGKCSFLKPASVADFDRAFAQMTETEHALIEDNRLNSSKNLERRIVSRSNASILKGDDRAIRFAGTLPDGQLVLGTAQIGATRKSHKKVVKIIVKSNEKDIPQLVCDSFFSQ